MDDLCEGPSRPTDPRPIHLIRSRGHSGTEVIREEVRASVVLDPTGWLRTGRSPNPGLVDRVRSGAARVETLLKDRQGDGAWDQQRSAGEGDPAGGRAVLLVMNVAVSWAVSNEKRAEMQVPPRSNDVNTINVSIG